MGRRARRRYREQAAIPDERAADEMQAIPDEHSEEADRDQEYIAYLVSLGDEADHAAFLESLGETDERQRPPKEKITWRWRDGREVNWHDYLNCRCHTCTDFRKANGIKRWEEEHPGEPDPWDTDTWDTDT
jgi:hypothetical protein